VPFVVVDSNVSLPATLISTGLMRKFWILLAFGAATYRAEHLQLELDALETEATDVGGEIQGREALKRLTTQAERARAAMEELLPVGTPSDWVAIGGVDCSPSMSARPRRWRRSFALILRQIQPRLAGRSRLCAWLQKLRSTRPTYLV
jgi:hypothetical protein